MTFRTLIVPGLLAAALTAGCEDPPPPPQPVKAAAVAPPSALPDPMAGAAAAADGGVGEVTAYVYAYDPVVKRDPFRSPFVTGQTKGGDEGTQPACEGPLANWDLDQLKLVATVTSDANPLGMVEDPQGKGHVVRRNAIVGKLCGKVTEVLRECITVTEYYPAPDGKRVPNPKKMCLVADMGQSPAEDLGTGKKF